MSEITYIEHIPYLGLFAILILGGLGFPFPEGVTLIIGGILSLSHIISPFIFLPTALSGVIIGDMLSYLIGKKYGHAVIKHRIFNRIVSQKRLSMFEEKFDRKGILFIFIAGRLVSGIFLIAGIMKMPLSKLFFYDIASTFSAIIIWGGIGYISGNSLAIITKDITRIEHFAILIVVVFLTVFLFYKRLKFSKINIQ
jgi:membrane protein DedA with SNARE-associated domain